MPRIYNGWNDPINFCKKCFPLEEDARVKYGEGEGPDGRGNCFDWDASHPPYEDEDYHCVKCKKLLEEIDN